MSEKIINIGDLVYIKSKHCSVELLCKVIMAQDYAIKVKLPCTINGYTHEVVQTKNARLKQPTQDRGEPTRAPYKNPVNNPFRRLVDSLTAESEEEEKARKEQEAKAEQKKQQQRIDVRAASAHIKKNTLGLSDEELDFMQGLSKSDQKAYLELLK